MARWTALVLFLVLVACGSENPDGTPSPSPTAAPGLPGVTAGTSSGSTAIVLVAADPAPGATLTGCGAAAEGCLGRIRMTFRLTATVAGTALRCAGFLHASNNLACLQGHTGQFTLNAGEVKTVALVFDTSDPAACRTPADITHLAFNVEGAGIDARQEWSLRYTLAP